MYTLADAERHILRSSQACVESPEHFMRAVFLAITSMQIPSRRYWPKLSRAWTEYLITGDPHAVNRIDGMLLYRSKADALRFVERELYAFHRVVESGDSEKLHDMLCEVPGIGPIKAGFIVQMATGTLGCIDTVNAKRLGIKNIFEVRSPQRYRDLLVEIGESTAELWKNWCDKVAHRDEFDPFALSESHPLFIETGRTNLLMWEQGRLF